jgi:hypothetical protein
LDHWSGEVVTHWRDAAFAAALVGLGLAGGYQLNRQRAVSLMRAEAIDRANFEVRWTSVSTMYPSVDGSQPEVAVFESREAAEAFAARLRQAAALLRWSGPLAHVEMRAVGPKP